MLKDVLLYVLTTVLWVLSTITAQPFSHFIHQKLDRNHVVFVFLDAKHQEKPILSLVCTACGYIVINGT